MKDPFIPVSQSIANQLTDMIFLEKKYQPNERLPNEHELSAQLGVSRASLREAIRLLAAKGILTVKRGSGTFVSAKGEYADVFGLAYLKDKMRLVHSWFEFRLILEPACIRLAIENGTAAELAAIIDSAQRMKTLHMTETEAIIREDQLFHTAIATATHNDIIQLTMPALAGAVRDALVTALQITAGAEPLENAMRYHEQIAEFISLRDAAGAALAMHYHLAIGMRNFKNPQDDFSAK